MKDVLAFVDCHNSPELGELTSSRPLASTSFLGRYAFMDFALSNLCNSGIPDVGILVKNHQRSILKHMGNMMSWVNNTKIGRETILYNEKGILNPSYNTDIENLRQNDWILYDSSPSHVVFESPHVILGIDLRPVLEEHIRRHEALTIVYKKILDAKSEFLNRAALEIGSDGYVKKIGINDGKSDEANVSMEIWIIDRSALTQIMSLHDRVDASFGMREMIASLVNKGLMKAHAYEFDGYARCFDSLRHYVDYSFELLNPGIAEKLFKPEWPVYTLTHDTPPALYGDQSVVHNSFVSNGCLIRGRVEDSIICRNVKIGIGASVKRSIILSNVSIGDSAVLNDVVIDKYSSVSKHHCLSGDPENVVYLGQGAVL